MNKSIVMCVLLLVGAGFSGCAPQPTETPIPTPVPPTATPALDADTLSQMLFEAVKTPDEAEVARLITAGASVDQTN